MTNTEGAKKRNRQSEKRTLRNKSNMNRLRTFIRKLEDLVASGKKEEAIVAFNTVQSVIAKSTQKGVIKKNTASRKVSRLHATVKALS